MSNKEEIRLFNVKCTKVINETNYTIIANNYYYFVLNHTDDSVYDWGITMLPRFDAMGHPIFNVVYPDGKLIYGVSMDMSIGSW